MIRRFFFGNDEGMNGEFFGNEYVVYLYSLAVVIARSVYIRNVESGRESSHFFLFAYCGGVMKKRKERRESFAERSLVEISHKDHRVLSLFYELCEDFHRFGSFGFCKTEVSYENFYILSLYIKHCAIYTACFVICRFGFVDRVGNDYDFVLFYRVFREKGVAVISKQFAPRKLCRFCKAAVMPRYLAYFRRRRLEKAAELLRSTRLKTGEIGMECGFADGSYFIKTFREIKHCTPKEYRAKFC